MRKSRLPRSNICATCLIPTYTRPLPGCAEVPSKAHCLARSLAVEWFETKSRVLWRLASPNGTFNWDVLFDKAGRQGEDRIDGQVVKANVDPSACCSGSPAGSTQWRLRADNSGFGHLFLAGAWIDTGFNVECIEAAVMSGKQAARAITGSESNDRRRGFPAFRTQPRRSRRGSFFARLKRWSRVSFGSPLAAQKGNWRDALRGPVDKTAGEANDLTRQDPRRDPRRRDRRADYGFRIDRAGPRQIVLRNHSVHVGLAAGRKRGGRPGQIAIWPRL